MMKNSSNIRVIHKLVTLCQWLIPICCCVLTFFSVAGVSSVKRCAYIGQAVKLLSIIGNDYADPSLYSENGTIIASWKENTNTVAYMDPNYSERIYMEERRNIWILSVERKDAGRYSFRFGVQVEQLDIELTVKEELTEEQLRECPNNRPDFPKEETTHILTTLPDLNKLREGISHDTTTAWSKKDYTEGKVMSEQKLQLLYNHPQKVMMEPCGSCNSLIIGLLSAILVITSLNIVLTNKTYISNGWITGKHWIQETLCCKHTRPKQFPQALEATRITIEESELTECQVQNWLEGHPDFMENYNESLTEFQIQDWLDLHPDFMKKYHDERENYHQSSVPTLDELGIKVPMTVAGVEVNQRKWVSTEMKVIAPKTCVSQSSDENELRLQAIPPSLDELGVTVKGEETGSESNSRSTGEHESRLHTTTPTLDELGITVKGTEREGSQMQWMSSQESVITYETYSSSRSDSFRETGHSGMQSIHRDEKKADQEGNKAQTDRVKNSGESMKEDPNSDDDYSAPLLSKSFIPK